MDKAPDAPDLVIVSRRVMPMTTPGAVVDGALAIRNGRIDRVAARDQVQAFLDAGVRVIDVGDRPLLPGFIDVHAHSEVACRASFGTVDVRAPECASVKDVQEHLAQQLAGTAAGDWIVGQANLFYDRKLAEGRLPTREELDFVSTRHPIAIRAGGHVTVLNTRGLEAAGIDDAYKPPAHSITGKPAVVRDQCGCATGVVKEMDNVLPLPGQDEAVIRESLRRGLREMFVENGVTTIGEISETIAGIGCMDTLARRGELGVRVRLYLWSPGTLPLADGCDWWRHFSLSADEEHLRVHGIKLFADGGYSAASAAVKQPYVHIPDHHRGDIALSEQEVSDALGRTRDADLQLAIHANGDRAQEWLCEMIERHDSPRPAQRTVRIEHAGNFRPDETTSEWWQRAGIIPVPQPVFLYTFGDYFVDYLGEYGTRGRFPFRTLLDDNWLLSGSSDVWVGSEREATRPMFGVWCCVKRQSYAGRIIDAEQRITVDEALRMHTIDAATVLGEQDQKGSLESGKLADAVVLDRDPTTCSDDDVRRIRADLTILAGQVIYDREPTG